LRHRKETLLIFLQTVGQDMIFQINEAKKLDTDRDFSPAERHVLQKLLCYKMYVGSIEEFRQKKKLALKKGWNDTGPVAETPNLALVAEQMEREILLRLKEDK